MLRGILDIGFSSYAVPTYSLVSEYFGFQEPRLGVGAKGHSMRAWAFVRGNVTSFRVRGLGFGPSTKGGVWSIDFLVMNQVGRVLRVDLQDV